MESSGRFLAGLALGGALVVSTALLTRTAVKFKQESQTITVTGSAKRRIESDLITWSAKVSTRAGTLAAAMRQLKQSTPQITAFLTKKGIQPAQVVVSAIATRPFHPTDSQGHTLEETISGYELTQTISVRSNEVDKVEQVSREATELIEQGVNLESEAPEYHYTKLADLKIQMLAEASKDSKVRAEQIATSTGARLGILKDAHMGVMQINPADSTETSSEGNNDTASLYKDVIAVVTASFAID